MDEIAVLAIETCLVGKLPALLSPDVICDLNDADIQRIAAESPDCTRERKRLTEKLRILESALVELRRLRKPGQEQVSGAS